jgi:hypothetical protein
MLRIPAIGLSISTRTSEWDAPGNDGIRRGSGRAVDRLSSSGKCVARGFGFRSAIPCAPATVL